jgi:hypothetical protein
MFLLLKGGVVQLHVVGSHASQAGQDLGKRGDDQVFAVAARKKSLSKHCFSFCFLYDSPSMFFKS